MKYWNVLKEKTLKQTKTNVCLIDFVTIVVLHLFCIKLDIFDKISLVAFVF